MVYNVTNHVAACKNLTGGTCELNLRFFSDEKVVMEMPIKEDDELWNEEFIVVSECQPRTLIYIICVLSVPVLIILFAFQ